MILSAIPKAWNILTNIISRFQNKRSQRADIFIDLMKEKLPKYPRLMFIALKKTSQAHVLDGTEEYWRQVHFLLVWLMQLYYM